MTDASFYSAVAIFVFVALFVAVMLVIKSKNADQRVDEKYVMKLKKRLSKAQRRKSA